MAHPTSGASLASADRGEQERNSNGRSAHGKAVATRGCSVCAGRHSAAVHDATLAVHEWLRERLRVLLEGQQAQPKQSQPQVQYTRKTSDQVFRVR